MIFTLSLAFISASSDNIEPELLYVGTFWLDLATLMILEQFVQTL